MTFRQPFCELLSRLEAYRHASQRDLLIAEIDTALQNPDMLTGLETRMLTDLKKLWGMSLDPNYEPPPYPDSTAVDVLSLRSRTAFDKTDYSESLKYAWLYFQYCAAGTISFHGALSDLANACASFGDMLLARYAAEMYLSHYDLLHRAAVHSETSVGIYGASQEHFWKNGPRLTEFSFPLRAALIGIEEEEVAPCWVRILELAASHMPARILSEKYDDVVKALRSYYQRQGDTERLAQLNTSHPLDQSETDKGTDTTE